MDVVRKIIIIMLQLFLLLLCAFDWFLIYNYDILITLLEELAKFSNVMKSLLVKLLI
jgi:hypothetical protein